MESRIAAAMFCSAGSPAASSVAWAKALRAAAMLSLSQEDDAECEDARARSRARDRARCGVRVLLHRSARVVPRQARDRNERPRTTDSHGATCRNHPAPSPHRRLATRRCLASRVRARNPVRASCSGLQLFALRRDCAAQCRLKRDWPWRRESRDRAKALRATRARRLHYAAGLHMRLRDRNVQSSPAARADAARRFARIRRRRLSSRCGLQPRARW